jgi:hypothetical protein
MADVSDIEEKFDEFERQFKTGFDGMQQAVDLSKDLPHPLTSIENYQVYVVVPFLCLCLLLQLWGVYATSRRTSEKFELDSVRFLADINENVTNNTLTSSADGTVDYTDDYTGRRSYLWFEICIAIQTYCTTVLQIALAFVVTQAKVMASWVNSQIFILERRVNRELKDAVGDVFESIFHQGFRAVRDKFLDVSRKLDKIEVHINGVKSKIPTGVHLPDSMTSSITEALPSPSGSILGMFGKK